MTVKAPCLANEEGRRKSTIQSRVINNAEIRKRNESALALVDLKRLEFFRLVVVAEFKTSIATSL